MTVPLTILVNSTDSFEDCWRPFFTLFATYWPNCPHPILLNTETKEFHYPALDIHCSQIARDEPNSSPTWSECLIRCLEKIDTEVILYLQEDYFLNGAVMVDQLHEFAAVIASEKYACIRLLECDGAGPWHATDHPLLWEVDRKSRYRISLQAALWRTDALRRCIRPHESPWQLEVWGSQRKYSRNMPIFCVNRDRFNDENGQVFPYVPTGVVKGLWNPQAVVDLFARHEIEVDFARRGFNDPGHPQKRKKRPILCRTWDRIRSLT
ncbi:MAG TPA: hypothetical protein ENH84_05740 [Phycisphaerae bacterium]|nr:hypothetical protein [Phycisphaerae bacterium]